MRAAVVTSFDSPPRYGEYPDPVAHGKDEVVEEMSIEVRRVTEFEDIEPYLTK
ncbi:hypothetical protein ACWEN6_36535 [Sphaerisporangium sp. NPDC004334]